MLRFVEVSANELSMMIRKSMDTRNWLTMKEPRRVSKLWDQVLEDLDILDLDISQILLKARVDEDVKSGLHSLNVFHF